MASKISLDKLLKLIETKNIDSQQVKDLLDEVKYPCLRSEIKMLDLSSLVTKNKIRLGIVGDTELNSKGCRMDYLHTLYSWFKEEAVQAVLHPGNFTDGINRYPGHSAEQKYQSFDEVVNHIVDDYPVGLQTYFIGGNFDRKYLTKLKRDICQEVVEHRHDLHYLGMNQARIRFNHVIVELKHPLRVNREAYTISQPLQKIIHRYKGGWKPNILLVGGYHTFYKIRRRGIEAFLVGSTTDPTATTMAESYSSDCGGLILDMFLNDKGGLEDLQWDIKTFYK